MVFQIIYLVLSVIMYVASGLICSKICVEIIQDKNPDCNLKLWFWAGFVMNVVGVLLTLIVRKKND